MSVTIFSFAMSAEEAQELRAMVAQLTAAWCVCENDVRQALKIAQATTEWCRLLCGKLRSRVGGAVE